MSQEYTKNISLDAKDKKVLKALAQNARASVADIARDTKLQRDTVAYRVGKFERQGLIKKYHAILDPELLGQHLFTLVLLKLKPVSVDEQRSFVSELKDIPHVTHIARMLGSHDYAVTIAAQNTQQLDSVLNEVKEIQRDLLTDVEVLAIANEPKIDDFSGLIDTLPTWGND